MLPSSRETPEQIDPAKSWIPLNLRSTWRTLSVLVLWTIFSNKDKTNSFEDISLNKASRPCLGVRLVFSQRAAISVDINEYLKVSHISIEWLTFANPIALSCLVDKYILHRTLKNFSRLRLILPFFHMGRELRISLFPTILEVICKRYKACWWRRILFSSVVSVSLTVENNGWFQAFLESPGDAGKTEFASPRHTGHRNSP